MYKTVKGKTVKEVCELTGLTRKLLHDYDKEGIVKPSGHKTMGYIDREGNRYDGYKLYDEDAVIKLQQIAIFRELGMERKIIKEKITASDYNRIKLLDEQIEMLKEKKEEIENKIVLAEQLKLMGLDGEYGKSIASIIKSKLAEIAEGIKKSETYYQKMISSVKLSNTYEKEMMDLFKKLNKVSLLVDDENLNKELLMKFFKLNIKELGTAGLAFVLGIGLTGEDGTLNQEIMKLNGGNSITVIKNLIKDFIEEYFTIVWNECEQILSEYEDIIGKDYSDERVKEMVSSIDEILLLYLGIKEKFEYEMLLNLFEYEPYKEGDSDIDYLLNAIKYYHI